MVDGTRVKGTGAVEMVLPVHGLTPYLRVAISTDDRALMVGHRRALLGLIPLWKHRFEVPLAELASVRVRTNVRLENLVVAAVLVATVFLLDPPIAAVVGLAFAGVLLVLLSVTKAMRVEREDGRSWTIPICWRYAFDVSLALLDAEQRRDAR